MRPSPALLFALALMATAPAGAQSSAPAGPLKTVWEGKKSGWDLVTPEQRTEVFAFNDAYKAYLKAARSAYYSTKEVMKQAKAAGFVEFNASSQVRPGARLIINGRDRAVMLVVVGSEPLASGLRVVATHHDSSHLDLKARPIYVTGAVAMFNTVEYGGIKRYQYANEPMALIGRVDTTDGKTIDVSIGMEDSDPVFVIPDNAPHSDTPLRNRTYQNVLESEELDPVAASIPTDGSLIATVMKEMTARYGIKEEDFVSGELHLVPARRPADVGIDRGLTGGYGQDDRLSSYCAARAALDLVGTPKKTAISYLTNHEEAGSVNNTGAKSEFFNNSVGRLLSAQKGKDYTDLDLRLALRASEVISADTNDGVNPLFSSTSEVTNTAKMGYGPAIKRYGRGFDGNSEFIAKIRAILDRASIPWQTQTPKQGVGGGGTIGQFFSEWDMEVIDMGVPLLSMHSTFEISSKVDTWNFYRFMSAFLTTP
ncbi:MAG: peptidase M18 [Vicinamibacteria bacterium]|nr:peptidase M18 [Vicinamibacteria bacterium]